MTFNRIVSIGLVLVIITLLAVMCENRQLSSENSVLSLNLQDATQQVKTWQDKAGQSRAEIASLTSSRAEIEKAFSKEIEAYEQEISRLHRINSIGQVTTETRDDVNISIEYPKDSSGTEIKQPGRFSYRDKWATITGTISDENLSLAYFVKDSLSFVNFSKKKGFLKGKERTIQVISHNPNTSIVGLRHISVSEKKKKWGIGISVGYGVGIGYRGPYLGVGIQRNVISF